MRSNTVSRVRLAASNTEDGLPVLSDSFQNRLLTIFFTLRSSLLFHFSHFNQLTHHWFYQFYLFRQVKWHHMQEKGFSYSTFLRRKEKAYTRAHSANLGCACVSARVACLYYMITSPMEWWVTAFPSAKRDKCTALVKRKFATFSQIWLSVSNWK